jgi:hypothetical protein
LAQPDPGQLRDTVTLDDITDHPLPLPQKSKDGSFQGIDRERKLSIRAVHQDESLFRSRVVTLDGSLSHGLDGA